MDRTQQLLAAILFILIFGALSFFAVKRNEKLSSSQQPDLLTYASDAYGYSFEYPAGDSIEEYTPQYVTIMGQTQMEVAEADVLIANTSSSYASFNDFVHSQAMLDCEADGPSGSVRCPDVASSEPYTSATGLSGDVLYLDEVTKENGATSTAQVGPLFVFNISANVQGSPYAALLIRPPLNATSSASNDTIDGIMRSLSIRKVE